MAQVPQSHQPGRHRHGCGGQEGGGWCPAHAAHRQLQMVHPAVGAEGEPVVLFCPDHLVIRNCIVIE